jgi:hypothetical protein
MSSKATDYDDLYPSVIALNAIEALAEEKASMKTINMSQIIQHHVAEAMVEYDNIIIYQQERITALEAKIEKVNKLVFMLVGKICAPIGGTEVPTANEIMQLMTALRNEFQEDDNNIEVAQETSSVNANLDLD